MDKRLWLKIAAGLSFFMAICQTVISISPAAAAYFQAPPSLLENRMQLLLIGEGAALVLVIFGLYALSGAGSIRRLPLLRLGLTGMQPFPVARTVFHSDRLSAPGNPKGRDPDPGSNFRPGVPGSRHHICARDSFELERHASSRVKLLLVSNTALPGSQDNFCQHLQPIQVIQIEPLQHDPVEACFGQFRQLFLDLCACPNDDPTLPQFFRRGIPVELARISYLCVGFSKYATGHQGAVVNK
jgi:hypothetical protein